MSKLALVFLAVALMMTVQASPAAAAPLSLDVEEIFVSQSKCFGNGTAEPSPYDFAVWINGSGITSVSMLDPHSVSHVLSVSVDGQWGFDESDFATLALLDASYGPGDYVFTFNGGADTVTVNYQYTEPTSFANITYPADGQTNVELNPVYTWDSVASYADADFLVMSLDEGPVGLAYDLYDDFPIDITTTSWQPGPLAPLTEYEFGILVVTAQGDPSTAMQTDGFDDFDYYGVFDYDNAVVFETGPAILGDFDGDNDVDGSDFGLWQSGYPTASGATLGDGDADGDGDVDGTDFGIWQANYPTNVGSAATIPEPTTLFVMLAAIGGLALVGPRRVLLPRRARR